MRRGWRRWSATCSTTRPSTRPTAAASRVVAAARRAARRCCAVIDNGVGIPPDMLEQRVRHVRAGRPHARPRAGRPGHRPVAGAAPGASCTAAACRAESAGAGHGQHASPCACRPSTCRRRTASPDGWMRGDAAAAAAHARAGRRRQRRRRRRAGDAARDAAATRRAPNTAAPAGTARPRDEFQPEVVFCDIGMPGMDGHEVAARLRADRRHASTLLVAVTGWGSEDDRRRRAAPASTCT